MNVVNTKVFIIRQELLQRKIIKLYKINYSIPKLMIFQKQVVPAQISGSIAKINQLLRLYEIVKKTDRSQKQIVKAKIQNIILIIKNYQFYDKIQTRVQKMIQIALSDPQKQTQISRTPSQVSHSVQSNRQANNKLFQGKIISDASISNNNIKSSQKSQGKNGSKTSIMNLQQKSLQFKTPPYSSSDFSNQKSQQSCNNVLLQNFDKFCSNVKENVVQAFVFNEDLFVQLKQFQTCNYVFLFGVKNPDSCKIKKLNICTLMNFSKEQIYQQNIKNKFNKQIKEFENNIRSPLGIIILGKGIQDLVIEHIRFLTQIRTPVPLLVIIKNLKQKEGEVYHFSNQTIDAVKYATKVQKNNLLQKIKQQYKSKIINLSRFQILKDKQIITKPLVRAIASAIQQAPNAIQIQSSNQCIKEQQTGFSFRFHTKFYVNTKGDYQVYLEENNIIRYKYNFKNTQFQLFKNFITKQDSPLKQKHFFISAGIIKQNNQISKQFFKLLFDSKNRDPFFFINFTGIKDKKTYIFLFNDNVTFKDIEQHDGIQLKNIQKEVKLFKTVAVITKSNYKNFECTIQEKIQGIQLKYK